MSSTDQNFFTVNELISIVGVSIPHNLQGELDFAEDDMGAIDDGDSGSEINSQILDYESSDEPNENNIVACVPNEANLHQSMEENAVISSEMIVDFGDLEAGKKRRRKPAMRLWTINQNKRLRMEGKAFPGFARKLASKKKTAVMRESRSQGATCNSLKCLKGSKRFCSLFTEELRTVIFENFWKNMDWNQKHIYVISLADKVNTKRKQIDGESRRSHSYVYYLKHEEEKKQVCKYMFLSTLGIKEKQFHGWMHKPANRHFRNISGTQEKPCTRENSKEKILLMNQFLDCLPKMPSHYCRKDTTRLYLEPLFRTKKELFDEYKEYCKLKNQDNLSLSKFYETVAQKNISIFHPKKDQCDICCSYKVNQITEEKYKLHQEKKRNARSSKEADKILARSGKCHVLTMDMESVKLSPTMKASSLYYKSKLIVHNFTVYDLDTHAAKGYWWDESEGELVASTFASCLVNFLSRYEDGKPIIIYSDGCVNQNRNAILANALLRYSISKNVEIFQKYLEVGHTQMECDSVHSCIEVKLKNVDVNLPTEYLAICLNSRAKPFPYEAEYLKHSFFTNYAESKIYASIRPGNKNGELHVTDVRCIKYLPLGTIEYKINYDDEWKSLPRKTQPMVAELSPLYLNRTPITKKKWMDLQSLKPVLKVEYHYYYDNIPFSN